MNETARVKPIPSRMGEHRDPFLRDRGRLLHSSVLRGLQAKTQVHDVSVSDFVRTRLTHSLEVGQVGIAALHRLRSVAPEQIRQYLPSDLLIETAAYGHDAGHSSYGHSGEVALNYKMAKYGGYEGNAQTLRIVTKLAEYESSGGMNLTRRTLLSLIKYPITYSQACHNNYPEQSSASRKQLKISDWAPPKSIYDSNQSELEWLIQDFSDTDKEIYTASEVVNGKHRRSLGNTLDTSLLNIADDISYGIHDLEDSLFLNLIDKEVWDEKITQPIKLMDVKGLSQDIERLSKQLFDKQPHVVKDAVGDLIAYLCSEISVEEVQPRALEPLLRYNCVLSSEADTIIKMFKSFNKQHVIYTARVQRGNFNGQHILMDLFDAFESEPHKLLEGEALARYRQMEDNGETPQRAVADYISSLSNNAVSKLHCSLFSSSLI